MIVSPVCLAVCAPPVFMDFKKRESLKSAARLMLLIVGAGQESGQGSQQAEKANKFKHKLCMKSITVFVDIEGMWKAC